MTPALLDTSKLIVGASGSGKTVTAKDEVAQLLDQGRQTLVIDPTGVWWGMRSNAAGDGPGFDLPIFGGEHGHVPIRADQGATIARIVIEQHRSAIVDLSGLTTSRDWRTFMRDLVAELRKRPRGNFHLVVDEADEFAAERPADDVGFALREDLVWIAKRGRAHGFVPTWITQRTAEIAKAVISQAQTVIAHQLVAPSDRKAIDDYLKGNGSAEARAEVMGSLAELQVGERWIYSPRLKLLERGVTPALATYDSSRTPAPGERLVAPRMLADLDVSAIVDALAPTPVPAGLPDDLIPADPMEAFAKGSVIGEMIVSRDRRIAELEGQLIDRDARIETLEFVAARALTIAGRITSDVEQLLAVVDQDHANLHPHDAGSGAAPDLETAADAGTEPVEAAEGASPPPPPGVSKDGGGAPDRELRALAGLAAVHPAGLSEAAWATRTGYSRKGGAWIRRRARYRDAGWIVQGNGRWYATPAGIAAAGSETPDMPPPGAALIDFWASRLGAPGRLLKTLAAVHPRALTRDALAAEVSMAAKGGAFLRHVGDLKAAELVTETGKRLGITPGLMEDPT